MNIDEKLACTPHSLNPNGFNPNCTLPYELKPEHNRVYAELANLAACQAWVCKLTSPQMVRMMEV